MEPAGAPRVDTRVETDGGSDVVVAEQLLHQFVGARLPIEDQLSSKMPERMGIEVDAGLLQMALDQISHGLEALERESIFLHKQEARPPIGDRGDETITVEK